MKKKRKVGRPSKYDPKFCKQIIAYFDIPHFEDKVVARVTGKNDYEREETKEIANPPRFVSGFARHIGVATSQIYDWEKKYPEFHYALKAARELQEEMLVSNGLKGLYAAAAFCFSMKNMFKWRDTYEHDLGKGASDTLTGIAKILAGGSQKEDDRLAAGEDPSLVYLGRAVGRPKNGRIGINSEN